jgi:alpha-1,6-mannosyltransferase
MTENARPQGTGANRNAIILATLGLAYLILYRIGVRTEGAPGIVRFLTVVALQTPIYIAAVWLSLRKDSSRSALIIGLVFAALFRLSILFSPPYLSDDMYRYIWDGRVQAAGINPYRYIPADQSLVGLRDEKIYPKINRRDYARTMYPPVAEGVYFLSTRVSESVTWMKATMVGFEAVAVWAIIQLLVSLGLPRQRVLIYAWHPMAVWEFAGSGHLDAIAIALVALALLARRKNADVATGIALASATLVKFFPIVLLPALYKRWNWKMPLAFAVTVVVCYLPYLSVGPVGALGFLPGYAGERGMISGEQFFILGIARRLLSLNVPTTPYIIFALLVMVVLAAWLMRGQESDRQGFLRSGLIMATAFMVLVSPHFSWYFAWLIPFLCFVPSAPVFYLTLASFTLYLTWLWWTPEPVFKIKAFLYLPFAILVAIAMWRRHSESGART